MWYLWSSLLQTVLFAPFWLKTHQSLTNSGFGYRLSFLNVAPSTHQGETSPSFSAFRSKGDNIRDWDFLWKNWQLFSMWRTLIVGVFCWRQDKHLSHEAHPFLQVLPSHHLPVYVTVFKSGVMSFTDGQERGVKGDGHPEPEQKKKEMISSEPKQTRIRVSFWKPLECIKKQI